MTGRWSSVTIDALAEDLIDQMAAKAGKAKAKKATKVMKKPAMAKAMKAKA